MAQDKNESKEVNAIEKWDRNKYVRMFDLIDPCHGLTSQDVQGKSGIPAVGDPHPCNPSVKVYCVTTNGSYVEIFYNGIVEPPLPRKEVISIKPGDVIVMSSSGYLSEKACDSIKDNATKAFPGIKIVILEEGLTMEVYREQGRYVDVTGLDGKREFVECVSSGPPAGLKEVCGKCNKYPCDCYREQSKAFNGGEITDYNTMREHAKESTGPM